jgi:hypothetical protein
MREFQTCRHSQRGFVVCAVAGSRDRGKFRAGKQSICVCFSFSANHSRCRVVISHAAASPAIAMSSADGAIREATHRLPEAAVADLPNLDHHFPRPRTWVSLSSTTWSTSRFPRCCWIHLLRWRPLRHLTCFLESSNCPVFGHFPDITCKSAIRFAQASAYR